MKRRPQHNARQSLRQLRGALTSAKLATQLETTSNAERLLWRCALDDLREAERAVVRRIAAWGRR